MRKALAVLAVVAALAVAMIVPMGANAASCDDKIYIFSRTGVFTGLQDAGAPGSAGGSTAAYNGFACLFYPTADPPHDFRYLTPGANQVAIRYLEGSGATHVVLSGLATGQYPLLHETADGAWMDSDNPGCRCSNIPTTSYPLPSGPGFVKADVYNGATFLATTTWRSVDQ